MTKDEFSNIRFLLTGHTTFTSKFVTTFRAENYPIVMKVTRHRVKHDEVQDTTTYRYNNKEFGSVDELLEEINN